MTDKKYVITAVVSIILSVLFFQIVYANPFSNRAPAEITITSQHNLDWLIKRHLIIDNVNNDSVSAYLSPEEFLTVQDNGLTVRWVTDDLKTLKSVKGVGFSYPTYEELKNELEQVASSYPDICKIESSGTSVQGRHLWWLKISDNVTIEEAEPEIHYISTMHGDEPVGTVLCMKFIEYLTLNYATDSRIKSLIDTTEIWIMPLMNPDGYEAGERWNANGKDLNRSFPRLLSGNSENLWPKVFREPEVAAIMDWSLHHTPVLSANFHAGALVVNYPFDYTNELCPDNDLFEFISREYSSSNIPMYNTNNPAVAADGIVRGVNWYQIDGGMQDWTYLATGNNQVTIELSSQKMPDILTLEGLWDDNRESMLAYMETVHCGIKGIVTDSYSGVPLPASIDIDNTGHLTYTDPDIGDYHRMLLPGNYTIHVEAAGYKPFSVPINISGDSSYELDVQLEAEENGDGGCFISKAAK